MNKCLNLKVRTKKGNKYTYCILKRLESTLKCEICTNCNDIEYKKVKEIKKSNKPIKQYSKKRIKLEKERYSIFTNDLEHCIENKEHLGHIDKHEIYEGKNRYKSIEYGLVIPFCRNCHQNKELQKKWQLIARKEFINKYSEELFVKKFQTKKGIIYDKSSRESI